MKKYYIGIKRRFSDGLVEIYYKLENDKESFFYVTQTPRRGNKRVKVERLVMKNNWPIVTKRIVQVNQPIIKKWKEEDEDTIIEWLRRGNPNDDARSSLFRFFGVSIFKLTDFERRYFNKNFSTVERLAAFHRSIKRECSNLGSGYTYRMFEGRSIIITPGKIKKAISELFELDPQQVLYGK